MKLHSTLVTILLKMMIACSKHFINNFLPFLKWVNVLLYYRIRRQRDWISIDRPLGSHWLLRVSLARKFCDNPDDNDDSEA